MRQRKSQVYAGPTTSDPAETAFEGRLANAKRQAQWLRARNQPCRLADIAARHNIPTRDLQRAVHGIRAEGGEENDAPGRK